VSFDERYDWRTTHIYCGSVTVIACRYKSDANMQISMVTLTLYIVHIITIHLQASTARAAASAHRDSSSSNSNSNANNKSAQLSPRRAASVRVPLKSMLTASAFQALASTSSTL
jgi:hypothetical protein